MVTTIYSCCNKVPVNVNPVKGYQRSCNQITAHRTDSCHGNNRSPSITGTLDVLCTVTSDGSLQNAYIKKSTSRVITCCLKAHSG